MNFLAQLYNLLTRIDFYIKKSTIKIPQNNIWLPVLLYQDLKLYQKLSISLYIHHVTDPHTKNLHKNLL